MYAKPVHGMEPVMLPHQVAMYFKQYFSRKPFIDALNFWDLISK